jgi:Zn-dependent peptidase ImmA (M78 family)
MITMSAEILDQVFGPGIGADPTARASHSEVEFVRSIDQLAYASEGARGRRLTAREALETYGFDVLRTVADEGSALLAADADAAGRVLRERRDQLRLTVLQVARRADLSPDLVEGIEKSCRRPVREYERVARALGLDERMVSFRAEPMGNDRIAVRLRTLQQTTRNRLSALAVSALAEAAWVAATQIRLERAFGLNEPEVRFSYSTDYGAPGWPAWRAGFKLAADVRELLSLASDPIPSLRDLCERRLRVPVIQAELGDDIAGATVESEGCRAVVLNLSGRNREVFVRRATLAHELGHILFDPPHSLDDLRVDRYDDLERAADQIVDPVEQRANAFAVELIAPQQAAVRRYMTATGDPLRGVIDDFGLSFTAARFQVWNGLKRDRRLEEITTPNYQPDPAWDAREAYTIDYHPVRSLARCPSRAGRFSAVALRAALERHISWDTASEWLMAPIDEIRAAASAVRGLFPDVFV